MKKKLIKRKEKKINNMASIYWVLVCGGCLGILAHTFTSARRINRTLEIKDIGSVFEKLWETDYLSIIGGCLFFGIMLFIASDYIDLEKLDKTDYSLSLANRIYRFKIANFIKTSSVIAGYFAESIIFGLLGTVEMVLKKKLDQLREAKPFDDSHKDSLFTKQ